MKKDVEGIIRKRNLIAQTRKTVMFWVAGAACVVGAAIVVTVMLVQNIMFTSDVIKDKNSTVSKIERNIAAVPVLKSKVRVLNTDEALGMVSVNSESKPLQSILDALPADDNRLALGASLQQKLLSDVPGLTVDSLSVDPSSSNGQVVAEDKSGKGLEELSFAASISGDPDALKLALQRLERSIRAIDVRSINGTSAGQNVSLQITGVAYYLPAPNLALTEKEMKQ